MGPGRAIHLRRPARTLFDSCPKQRSFIGTCNTRLRKLDEYKKKMAVETLRMLPDFQSRETPKAVGNVVSHRLWRSRSRGLYGPCAGNLCALAAAQRPAPRAAAKRAFLNRPPRSPTSACSRWLFPSART